MIHFVLDMGIGELPRGSEALLSAAPNFSEIRTHVRIDAMTAKEKLDWLSSKALQLEHKYLREPHGITKQLAAEAKIIFLTGGESGDVTEERDFEGNLIHTRHLDRPRPMFAEIPEALGAISHWFDITRQNQDNNLPPPSPVAALSEISDVVYNVSHLLTLDPKFQENYTEYLSRIAGSLGYDLDQLLTIAMYKYNFRLGQGKTQKNIGIENDLIAKVLKKTDRDGKPLYTTPTESQFQKTFQTLSKVQGLLNTRKAQLKEAFEWDRDPVIKK